MELIAPIIAAIQEMNTQVEANKKMYHLMVNGIEKDIQSLKEENKSLRMELIQQRKELNELKEVVKRLAFKFKD